MTREDQIKNIRYLVENLIAGGWTVPDDEIAAGLNTAARDNPVDGREVNGLIATSITLYEMANQMTANAIANSQPAPEDDRLMSDVAAEMSEQMVGGLGWPAKVGLAHSMNYRNAKRSDVAAARTSAGQPPYPTRNPTT